MKIHIVAYETAEAIAESEHGKYTIATAQVNAEGEFTICLTRQETNAYTAEETHAIGMMLVTLAKRNLTPVGALEIEL